MARSKWWAAGVSAALMVGAAGCGGGGAPPVSSSNEEVEVRGTVNVNGTPLDAGEITFDPSNIKRKDATARTAKVEKGAYTIKTLVGTNGVTVHSPAIDKDDALSTNYKSVEVKAG